MAFAVGNKSYSVEKIIEAGLQKTPSFINNHIDEITSIRNSGNRSNNADWG
jgi:hypothetical protein